MDRWQIEKGLNVTKITVLLQEPALIVYEIKHINLHCALKSQIVLFIISKIPLVSKVLYFCDITMLKYVGYLRVGTACVSTVTY